MAEKKNHSKMTFAKLLSALAPAGEIFPKPPKKDLGTVFSKDHRILTGPLVLVTEGKGELSELGLIPNLAVSSSLNDSSSARVVYNNIVRSAGESVLEVDKVTLAKNKVIIGVKGGNTVIIRPIVKDDLKQFERILGLRFESIEALQNFAIALTEKKSNGN